MDKLINYEKLSEFKNKLLNDNVASPKATWSSKKITTHINAELANYATTASVDASLALKADKSYVDSSLALKQNLLSAGQNIAIDASNNISALGYIFDTSNGSFANIYRQDSEDGGQLVANTASGLSAVAEGYNTQATGDYGAHAEGASTTASGVSSHAEGDSTEASGDWGAHAEGCQTKASYTTVGGYNHGTGAHAEGWSTEAKHDGAHAEGVYTLASEQGAHAEGSGSQTELVQALGVASHAEGVKTIARNRGEHAEGFRNISHTTGSQTPDNGGNTAHSVGVGTNNLRRNAEEIMYNGDIYVFGIGNYDGIHIKNEQGAPAGLQTLQEVIANKANVYEVATTAEIEALFAAPEPEPTGPASNEIWYTSYQNRVVTPTNTEGLPAIVSNTNVNGKGKIEFASTITSLPEFMFEENPIETIMLPETVTTLGEGAFKSTNLKSFIFPENVTVIPMGVFQDSTVLEYVELPAGITSIGNFAFSVSQYGHLASITYKGTVAQWNAITKDTNWKQGATKLTVVHCSDSDVNL